MSLRKEQCNKVCRILDDVLANRPTERDSLIVATRKAFESLEQVPSTEPKRGKWVKDKSTGYLVCDQCRDVYINPEWPADGHWKFCPNCGARNA